MLSIFPPDDDRQKLRLQRYFMALACYALWLVFGFGMYLTGFMSLPSQMVVPILAGVCVTNLYFYVFIRSGLNRHFNDPSLTFSQIIVAMTWILVLMFVAADSRSVLLPVYVMSLLFGVFQLRRKDFMVLAAFGLAGYLAVVALDFLIFRERFDLRVEVLRSSVLAGTMLWAAVFGSHVSGLRNKLRNRNHELREALEVVHHAARHDHLTQAYNRRYVMQTIKAEKTRADRTRRPFSVVILDLDHFKIINDRYGHLAGDRVLVAFSERTKGTLRGMDFIGSEGVRTFGRYGGEEFIVLLPETDLGGGYRCAERVRYVTEDEPFDDVFKVTVSSGVAEYRLGESIEDTLRRADAALYRAKDNGRNCVVADDTPTSGIYSLLTEDEVSPNVVVGQFGS
ncbi:MAG: GGDEF domain-containing protein [Gammaproteobacteria bacterium]|nr:GGDEF domain-containing protein [Gammaproteobacteria bacterium]NNF60113.1 GGDEF domain-containing protein [Gammaproteobacteria bacterium]NNM21525.1 GGDEF domain-containing protein [Gammaproteobacteria bacterium]